MKKEIAWFLRECKIWLLEISAKTDKMLARFLPPSVRWSLTLTVLFYCCLVVPTLTWIIVLYLLFGETVGVHYIAPFAGACVPYAVLWAVAVAEKKRRLNILLTACMAVPWLVLAHQDGGSGYVIKTTAVFILAAGMAGDWCIANKNMDAEGLIKLHKKILPYLFKCFAVAVAALALHAVLI